MKPNQTRLQLLRNRELSEGFENLSRDPGSIKSALG